MFIPIVGADKFSGAGEKELSISFHSSSEKEEEEEAGNATSHLKHPEEQRSHTRGIITTVFSSSFVVVGPSSSFCVVA